MDYQKKKDIDDKIEIKIKNLFLPITISKNNLSAVFSQNTEFKKVLAIVIGTKPDFYKQAPLLLEAKKGKFTCFYNLYRSAL